MVRPYQISKFKLQAIANRPTQTRKDATSAFTAAAEEHGGGGASEQHSTDQGLGTRHSAAERAHGASGVVPSATSNTQTAAANAKKPRPPLVGRVARKAAPSADGVMPPSDDDEHGHDGGDEAR